MNKRKKTGKANEKRRTGKVKKRAKDEEVNGQGGKRGKGGARPHVGQHHKPEKDLNHFEAA